MNSKPLPNKAYRCSAAVSLVATILLVSPVYFDTASNIAPLALMVVGTVLCTETAIFIKRFKRDDYVIYELYQACIMPSFIYLCFRFWPSDKAIRGVIIAAVVGAVYIAILLKINVIDSKKWGNKRYLKKVIAVGLYNIRTATIVVLMGLLLYAEFVSPDLALPRMDSKELKAWSEDRTLAAHYDELDVLRDEEVFSKITDTDERLAIFAAAVDVESNYQGIPFGITVHAKKLDDGVAAGYDDVRQMILIDKEYLAACSAEELIKVSAHECRHAYQHELIRLYRKVRDDDESAVFMQNRFDHIEDYALEFDDYKDLDDGVEEYLEQYCEQDSYEYAETSYDNWVKRMAEIEEERNANK